MSYYDQNAQAYFDSTFQVEMESLYAPFLARLQPGNTILDAGCGSGRDAQAFARRGYRVLAFDASEQLVTLARKNTGLDIQHGTFFDFQTSPQSLHAIWACASLLHLPVAQLPETLNHLARFLAPDGVFYCSFKYGEGEVEQDGRRFTNLNETQLVRILSETCFIMDRIWQTDDLRPGHEDEKWLNAILVKG